MDLKLSMHASGGSGVREPSFTPTLNNQTCGELEHTRPRDTRDTRAHGSHRDRLNLVLEDEVPNHNEQTHTLTRPRDDRIRGRLKATTPEPAEPLWGPVSATPPSIV